MPNVIYDYPKSSCDCYKCTDVSYLSETKGTPSNMPTVNCKTPDMFNCYNSKPFRYNIEPTNQDGYVNLNPDVMISQYARDFQRIENSTNWPKVQFVSKDPRLISASHSGQVLTLDRPPIETQPDLDTISTDKTLNKYGQDYRTYSDVNAGQISYYIDKSIEDPFFLPVFATSAKSFGTLYQDPMGAMKPIYDRKPLTCTNHLNTTRNNYSGGLSWIEDSQEFREDIISKQMARRNQERWEPRWANGM